MKLQIFCYEFILTGKSFSQCTSNANIFYESLNKLLSDSWFFFVVFESGADIEGKRSVGSGVGVETGDREVSEVSTGSGNQ